MNILNKQNWDAANRKLIAKSLSELHFEEVLQFERNDQGTYVLKAGHEWSFTARTTLWGMLVVDPASISVSQKQVGSGNDGQEILKPTLNQFFLDVRELINITNINLSAFLEEIQQTLYSEMARLSVIEGVSAQEMVLCDEVARQKYLDAHPKLIANKGRLGWGVPELAQYSPETSTGFKLHFFAVKKSACLTGIRTDVDLKTLLLDVMEQSELDALISPIQPELDDYVIMAVHPWQVQRYIYGQYTEYMIDGTLVDLGVAGKAYIPQQSIRTLSDPTLSSQYDIKTAVTIINTSCYRGITGKFIAHGARVSAWLSDVVSRDPLLSERGMRVQQELAGFYCPHPYQAQFEGAYQYNEMLGCVWRENASALLGTEKRPLAMATLMQTDALGKPCLHALIEQSPLNEVNWLEKLFNHVVIPLYHLMSQYGVGLVAHGQNITLVLDEQNIPCGCMIKDFHGDLRLVDEEFDELQSLDEDIKKNLTRLPGPYLAHDLITGHFVTVLRFISAHVEDEGRFYDTLRSQINAYKAAHPQLQARFALFDILKPKLEKLCVNKVRFKIGLADSEERPLPDLATPIDNPLLKG